MLNTRHRAFFVFVHRSGGRKRRGLAFAQGIFLLCAQMWGPRKKGTCLCGPASVPASCSHARRLVALATSLWLYECPLTPRAPPLQAPSQKRLIRGGGGGVLGSSAQPPWLRGAEGSNQQPLLVPSRNCEARPQTVGRQNCAAPSEASGFHF